MSRKLVVLALLAGLLVGSGAARAEDDARSDALAKTLVSGTDADERVAAGIKLAGTDPNAYAAALDDLVKEKREGDVKILASIGVKLKPATTRLYTVWAASRLDGAADAFAFKIDNDHPYESMRAIDALGYLGDPSVVDKLMFQLRSQKELIGVQAARALCRVATKKQAKDLVDAALDIDNEHVRQHICWTLKDVLKSSKAAGGMFARYQGDRGTVGFRAKEALSFLQDDETRPENYKEKLDTVKDFFGKRSGVKAPPVSGPEEYRVPVEKALADLEKEAPDWFHLVATAVKEITITGSEDLFDVNRQVINLRLRDLVNWKEEDGTFRTQLASYYLIRYATIIFLSKMGDPSEGHRGWEEGLTAGWWYAMDYTKIAVDEELYEFLKGIINARPPPWASQ